LALAILSYETPGNGQEIPEAPAQGILEESSATLAIRVYQKGTGIPLKRVEIKAGSLIFYTDAQGRAEFSVDLSGSRDDGVITARRNGYEELTKPIGTQALKPGDELIVEFYLEAKLADDDAIRIKGERRTNISKKIITTYESKKIAPGGDPAQIIKLMPGVQTQNFSSRVIIRGSGPEDSKYYVDDIEVPILFHNIGQLSVMPEPLLAEIQFDSGGFGVEYGDATGGVIVLKTITDPARRQKSAFVINLPFYSGIYHQSPLSDQSLIAASFRRSYIDLLIKSFLESRSDDDAGGELTIAPHFADAHIFYLKKTDGGHTKLSVIAAEDGLKAIAPTDISANESGTSEFSLDTKFINLGWERQLRLPGDWRMKSTPQIYFLAIDNNFAGNEVALDILKLRVPSEFTKRLGRTEDFYFGLDPEWVQTESRIHSIIPRFDDPTFDFEDAEKELIKRTVTFINFRTWAAIDLVLGNVKMTPGLRLSYNSQIKATVLDPRFRAVIALTKEQRLKFALGQYSKSPEPREASKQAGNPDLQFERSHHYVLGWASDWSLAFSSELQLFYKRAIDVIYSDSETRYNNNGSFLSRGIEVFFRRNLTSRLFGWLSYTYSVTTARKSDQERFRPANYDQTHVLNLASSYRLTNTWDLGGRLANQTGNTFTPVRKAVYNGNLDKYQPRYDPEDENAKRLPNNNSLTAYFTKTFLRDTWKMELKFGVESYWWEPPVLGVQYNYDFSKEEQQVGLPAFPFIEFSGEF
jgi:hypothetical protein